MDKLETPYDEEAEFIECTVCDKSIRGDTLYKIHLTTPGHIKKEDAIVAAGHAVRKRTMPEFKDILQYLDYLNLDEPIIGLSFLDEVPCNDPQGGPKYFCRLCHLTAILSEMVHHVIGRKHRQKYVELKRPDLVTWDKQSIITQGGKIIRARAEIIERQDGRGRPMPLANKGTEGKLNISRVPPKEKHNRNRNIPPKLTQQNVPPLLPELKNYRNEYSHRERYPTGHTHTPLFHSREPGANRGRRQDDTFGRDFLEEELGGTTHRESDIYIRENMDPDYHDEYEEEDINDPHNFFSPRAVLEAGSVIEYDSGEEMPHGQAQHIESYSDKAHPYRGPYPENDPLKEFYTEEVRRRRVISAEYPKQRAYPEDEKRWSLERESVRRETIVRRGSHGSIEPEVKKGNFPAPVESDQSHDYTFCVIRDYQHERMEPHPENIMSNSGPGRRAPPTSQREVEVNRTMSNIPEPFRRFLKGANNDESHGKRKRKSRFSDATAEEVVMTNEMFTDQYGPPNPKFGGHPRPASVQMRHESHGSQHTECYTESQGPHHNQSYQKEGFGSESIFDMLKNIEIENAEEADLLKNKLCNLLKEFKSKKSEKAVQNIQGRAVMNNSYSFIADPELSPRYHYERDLREDSDFKREDYFKEDHRGRGWKEHEHIPAKQSIEHHSLGHGEPRYTKRSPREELFGWPEMPRAPRPNETAQYPERFQERIHPRGYQPTVEQYFDTHSSAPSLHMEREPRMNRESRCSKNLDKITSTLLELVARK